MPHEVKRKQHGLQKKTGLLYARGAFIEPLDAGARDHRLSVSFSGVLGVD